MSHFLQWVVFQKFGFIVIERRKSVLRLHIRMIINGRWKRFSTFYKDKYLNVKEALRALSLIHTGV